jgi:hypothetical protein
MIPQQLKDIKQWSYSFSADEIKRPKHSHYTPNGSLTYTQAVTAARMSDLSFGFYTTERDPYVIGDIDHIANPEDPTTLPPAMTDLLLNKGLYCEVSPSGEGIRFVGKLPNIRDKAELRGKIFYTREPMVDKREAQINVAPPWLRFTGNQTSYSSDDIPTLTLNEWGEVFALKKVSEPEVVSLKGVPHGTPSDDAGNVPTFQEMSKVLRSLPLDQNPRIQRAYERVFEESYSHYNFWLRVIMGVHDFTVRAGHSMECLQEIVEWSSRDVDSYTGEEDVINKWKSLSTKTEKVSYHTVFAVAYHNQINWPQPKPLSKKQKSAGMSDKQPMNTEYSNFKEMVRFYNLKLYRDSHTSAKMYIAGDQDILDTYFKSFDTQFYYEEYLGIYVEKSLTSAFHIMAQEVGFVGLTHSQINQHIRDWMFQIRYQVDLVKKYFDTPFEDLPESYQDNKEFYSISTVERMYKCLTVDYMTSDHAKEDRLYYKYYKSWLMGFVRALYWPDDPHMNNCVLLLTGREQVRKTSHFRYMLPKFMRSERIAFTTHGFSTEGAMRDIAKLSAGNSLLVWDEIEQFLTSETESNFKKIIDNTTQKFIDKYETVETVCSPISIYGATSNKREFKLSDTGSRRLFHIPVKWVETDKLDRICWHRIVSDLREEIANHTGADPPWLLTRDELIYQDTLHGRITSKSGLELLVREVFDFQIKCFLPRSGEEISGVINVLKDPRFLSTKSVIDQLSIYSNGKININRAHLTKILHNVCGQWTGTKHDTKVFIKPKMQVTKGLAYYGGGSHKLWVLPKAVNPYES